MPIVARKQAAIPAGDYEGVITNAKLDKKIFDPRTGPEETVEITIQPKWKAPEGGETLAVSCVFSPILNGLSGLSRLLERVGKHPKEGVTWEPSGLIGTEVRFTAQLNDRGFAVIVKDSIRKV